MSDSGKRTGLSDYEELRLQNVLENKKQLELLFEKKAPSEFVTTPSESANTPSVSAEQAMTSIQKKRRSVRERKILVPQRRSSRLSAKPLDFNKKPSEENKLRIYMFGRQARNSYGSEEEWDAGGNFLGFKEHQDNPKEEWKDKFQRIFENSGPAKLCRATYGRSSSFVNFDFIPPEKITEDQLNNIAECVSEKLRCIDINVDGTTCHQCRQKTIDTKTICRSGYCQGGRGQFCGVCLRNRYGESAREALLNPTWSCPPCRNICNCSICRRRHGLIPTGIMYPQVTASGYTSVHESLMDVENVD